MDTKRFERLLVRMDRSGVSGAAEGQVLKGCTESEIRAVETRYNLRLPMTYRQYLHVMGKRSGRLFTSDHLAVFYENVREMTADLKTRKLARSGGDITPPAGFAVPDKAFFIASRLDSQFEFITCDASDDSPVWYFSEGDWMVRQSHASVMDWLESWCGYAEDAIASGYFSRNPKGTVP